MQLAELARFVDELDATVEFYGTLLDAGLTGRWPGGATFDLGGPTLLVHERYTPAPGDLPPEDHAAFAVEDVDAACEALAEHGLALEHDPADDAWGRSAYLRDPAENLAELTVG